MNIALWIVQCLLALAFAMAGIVKVRTPVEELAQKMAWVEAVPPFLPEVIGIAEIAGAVGLVLPSVLRIKPDLTPLAAGCLAMVMGLAGWLHWTRGEQSGVTINVVLLLLCLFVAWGRSTKSIILPGSRRSLRG